MKARALLVLAAAACAQSPEGGNTDLFYEVGMGAYSLGRGHTYAGEIPESLGTPLNPATLGPYQDFNVHFFTAPMDSSNLYLVQATYRTPRWGNGSLSWSMWRDAPQLYQDSSNVRFDQYGRPIVDSSYFSNADHLFMWSHGRELAGGFSVGFNLKYIRRSQGADYTGQGAGFDLGLVQKDWIPGLSWGLVLENLGKARIAYPGGHRDYFNQVGRVGVKYEIMPGLVDCSLDISRVLSLDSQYGIKTYLGVQYFPIPAFSIRGGIHNVEYADGTLYYFFSLGLGLRLEQFVINYALWESPDGTGFNSPHRISIVYRLPLNELPGRGKN